MARWKVSFDPHGSPTGGPVAADIRERTAFAAGTTRALFRLADLRKCDQDRFTAPSAGRDPSRFGTAFASLERYTSRFTSPVEWRGCHHRSSRIVRSTLRGAR